MSELKIAMLVHGSEDSIEAVRARGLTQNQPPENVHFLWRAKARRGTATLWRQQLAQLKPDVLYVMNTALPGAWLAPWLHSRTGVPYVLDTGDVIFEMACRAGLEPAWKLPLLKWAEQLAQKQAHTIVVRGTRHQEYLKRIGLKNVAVIRDGCSSINHVSPEAVTALRERYHLGNEFVVGVMGSLVYSPRLGICYGWDLIQALAQLRDLPIRGVIIGDGNGRPWLEAQARQYGVADRVHFCGRVPYEQVPAYLRLLDVALSTQTNNLPGQVRTTGKLPEYMLAERFILASRVGEAALLLPEIMLVDYTGEVDEHYPGRLAERIRYLWHNRGALLARHTLPELVQRECSYPVLSRKFDAVMEAVVKKR